MYSEFYDYLEQLYSDRGVANGVAAATTYVDDTCNFGSEFDEIELDEL